MVSLIEYWRELGLTIGAIVTFLAGRKSTKLQEKKQTVDAIDAMQKTYDVFLKHYEDNYNKLLARLDNLELRNTILTESSQAWEKKFKDLAKEYESFKKEHESLKNAFESYKKNHNK